MSETQEQRLAGIRERAETWLIGELHYIPGRELTEAAGICAAFADSEIERVLLEAAKAQCEYCCDEVNWHPAIITATAAYDPDWRHPRKTPDGMGSTGYALDCDAGPIHDLRSKGESQ